MIHIVTGYMRSGTSAMMAALMAGGMQAAFSEERNAVAAACSDQYYHPNRSGLYEVPLEEYTETDFPLQYDGRLIKVMAWGMRSLAVHDYCVVIMLRDQEEIRQSYEAFFGRKLRTQWFANYQNNMVELQSQLNNRSDVRSVSVVNYRNLIENPQLELAKLEWPIDIAMAASVIDPQQYRFRLEDLTIGI